MTCCIQIDTPQSIYDEGNDYYEAETDIFEEIFEKASVNLEYDTLMQAAMWAVFRYRMIANCDTEEWVQVMADRLDMVGPKWDAIIDATDGLDLADLKEMHYKRTIQRTAITGTEGDVRTLSHSGHDDTLFEGENMPQTETSATKYLDRRDTTRFTPGVTDTEKYHPNTQDDETYDEEKDLAAVTFSRMMDSYPQIMTRFCDEFEAYFLVML
jgi:hypothetical protein